MCNCRKNSIYSNTTAQGCPGKYVELRDYSLRILNLLQKGEDDTLNQLNGQLRSWMSDINKRCPSETDIEIVKNYIRKKENG